MSKMILFDKIKNTFDEMSAEALNLKLIELSELHQEITEERWWILEGTSGLHRSTAHIVAKYEKELGELDKCIDYIQRKLQNQYR